jgi:MarR-like DNA-binding transcriptional regulator SgrR of sgrS sRNA
MPDRTTDILNWLDQTRREVKQILDRLQPDDWEKPIQEEDQHWTARQIVSHMVSAQKGMSGQIARISAGEETVPPDFDLNRWNRRSVEKSADKTPQELLAALDEDREALKQTLRGLQDSDFDKRGRHGSLRIMSVEEIARLIGTHEAEHARIIAEKLGLPVELG